eukprot:gene3063-55567_t
MSVTIDGRELELSDARDADEVVRKLVSKLTDALAAADAAQHPARPAVNVRLMYCGPFQPHHLRAIFEAAAVHRGVRVTLDSCGVDDAGAGAAADAIRVHQGIERIALWSNPA